MPIQLPRLTLPRREFLRRTLTGAAALTLGPSLRADDKAVDPNLWIFLSDPHIAADRKSVQRGVNMADNLVKAASQLAALKSRPVATFVNGDCAYNTGETADYATFAELMQPVRALSPVHLTLGNHDHRDHFWTALEESARLPRPVQDRQVELIRSPQANWFLLDTLDKPKSVPGSLGPEQLSWLARALDENSSKPAIILGHHNPQKGNENGALTDTAELMKILEPRRHVKAYIFGHTHHWSVETAESGIHLVNLPPVAYLFKAGEPNGWVRGDLKPSGLRLQLQCFDETHAAHGQVRDLTWRA